MDEINETEHGDSSTLQPPISIQEVVGWLERTAEAVRSGAITPEELVRVLGQLREVSTAFANASDWALLAAREAGVSLRGAAPAFGKGYVRSPAARLEKLHRVALTADDFLALVRRHGGEQAQV